MSLAATCWAWEQKLPADEKLLLIALADCHDPDRNRCIFSIKRISGMIGFDEEVTVNLLYHLTSDGLIGQVSAYNSVLSEASMAL